MQKAPVLKSSGLTPIDDGAVHVFGRNLEERVVSRKEEEEKEESTKSVVEEQKDEDVETIKKRKFETITGEEDEETVFQGDFKLFVWDLATSNWIEKGRGQLKLNDSLDTDGSKSRLIMRIGGTYRIVLNVAIQHSFFKVINISKTSIRFTDSQNVWAASGNNARQLGDLIDERLEIAAVLAKREKREEKNVNDNNLEERIDEKCVEIEHRPADEPEINSSEDESGDEVDGDEEEDDEDREKEEEIKETQTIECNEDTRQKEVLGETGHAEKTEVARDTEKEEPVKEAKTKDEEEVASEDKGEGTEENREQVDIESEKIKLGSS